MVPGKDYIGVACGVLLFNAEGQFLMMLRSQNTRADRGRWGIPGGQVEFNETMEDAIRREAKEETNVDLGDIEPIGYVDHILLDEGKHFVSQIFVALHYSGVPTNMEPDKFDRFEWFSIGKLPKNTSTAVLKGVSHYREWKKTKK